MSHWYSSADFHDTRRFLWVGGRAGLQSLGEYNTFLDLACQNPPGSLPRNFIFLAVFMLANGIQSDYDGLPHFLG